jgi:hypothetical protein
MKNRCRGTLDAWRDFVFAVAEDRYLAVHEHNVSTPA